MENLTNIFARNCVVRRITKPEAGAFLGANHRYGDASCRYRYGLFVIRSTGANEERLMPCSTGANEERLMPRSTGANEERLMPCGTGANEVKLMPRSYDANEEKLMSWSTSDNEKKQMPCSTGANCEMGASVGAVSETMPEERLAPGTLVAVAEFSSARRMADGSRSCEWVRYASLKGRRVQGGMGKLLACFIKEVQPDDVMTYCDPDSVDGGDVYKKLGFVSEGTVSKPNFTCEKFRLIIPRP